MSATPDDGNPGGPPLLPFLDPPPLLPPAPAKLVGPPGFPPMTVAAAFDELWGHIAEARRLLDEATPSLMQDDAPPRLRKQRERHYHSIINGVAVADRIAELGQRVELEAQQIIRF